MILLFKAVGYDILTSSEKKNEPKVYRYTYSFMEYKITNLAHE